VEGRIFCPIPRPDRLWEGGGVGEALIPIEWVTEAYFPGLKQPACEADYPFTTGGKVMNAGSHRTTSTYIQWHLL